MSNNNSYKRKGYKLERDMEGVRGTIVKGLKDTNTVYSCLKL